MKLARIALHTAFGILVFGGLVGTATAAAKTNSNTGSGASNTPSSSASGTSSSSNSQSSAAGIQIYTSKSALQFGTVVQLDSKSSSTVTPATYTAMKDMYGVVVDPNTLPLTISADNLANQTYVATNGTYKVLVDTQNGTIKNGDYVTMSAVDGVAMKAGTYDEQAMVFGRAVSGFDGKANVIGTTSLKKSNGGTQTVQIGIVSVSINIQRNPNDKSTKTNLPPLLQKVGQEIAQRNVSPVRIYLAITITGLCIIVALVTLYAGVRNAMIAIGRNPLSKKSIFRGLFEIVLTSFLILIIGLFAVYLLLKL